MIKSFLCCLLFPSFLRNCVAFSPISCRNSSTLLTVCWLLLYFTLYSGHFARRQQNTLERYLLKDKKLVFPGVGTKLWNQLSASICPACSTVFEVCSSFHWTLEDPSKCSSFLISPALSTSDFVALWSTVPIWFPGHRTLVFNHLAFYWLFWQLNIGIHNMLAPVWSLHMLYWYSM